MQFTVLINQQRALEWGLNAPQAMLFAFLFATPTWAEATEMNGIAYCYVSKNKVCEEMPLLTDKPNTVYRLMKQLEANGLIYMACIDNQTHIAITKKGAMWNSSTTDTGGGKKSDPLKNIRKGSEKNPSEVGKKSELGSEKNPTNQITIDQITRSNNHNHKITYPDWFESLWENYPERLGNDDRDKAFQAASARLAEGKTECDLNSALDRYRKFVIATNRIGTEFVLMAVTFFGRAEHIDNVWHVPQRALQKRSPRDVPLIEQLTDKSWADAYRKVLPHDA